MKTEKPKHRKTTDKKPGKQPSPSLAGIRIDQISKVLDLIMQWQYPANTVLANWFRDNGRAGARDRSEISHAIYDVLRHLRRYRQFAQSGQGSNSRRLAILGLASIWNREQLDEALDNYEQAWLNHVTNFPIEDLPVAVRYSVPDWLLGELSGVKDIESLLSAFNKQATLDLRVNTLKAGRDQILDQLKNQPKLDSTFSTTLYSPFGIRVDGNPAINRMEIFKNGQIEIQDEGSQLLGILLAPRRGELIIDYCAGSGGKTLLLGAMMRSTGRLYAFDVSAARLARAKQRLARSGLSNVVSVVISDNDHRVKRLRGKADRVLVDAPCSGLGIMRRNPDIKWRQQPADIDELCATQSQILQQAASCLKPGGRLVYATCSILARENEHQVENFLANNSDFKLLNASDILANRKIDIKFDDNYLRLRPDWHNTDGFFAAVFEKNQH